MMAKQLESPEVKETIGIIAELVRNLQLIWRLFNDPRVSAGLKLIVPLAIVYIISPLDLIPDFLPGLGQLDDLAILLLSIKLFIDLAPKDIVQEHLDAMRSVRTSYRVVDDDDRSAPNSAPRLSVGADVSEERQQAKPSQYLAAGEPGNKLSSL
jgi:uncharacterized membrane protein YkvA (DUF1232 family)